MAATQPGVENDYHMIKDGQSIFDQGIRSAKSRQSYKSTTNAIKPSIAFTAVGRNSVPEYTIQKASLLQQARKHEAKANNNNMVSILAHREKTLRSRGIILLDEQAFSQYEELVSKKSALES